MSSLTFRHGLLVGAASAALFWASSTWVQAQGQEALLKALQDAAPAQVPKVYSGTDIGFQAKRGDRGSVVFVPVVRVNGDWVEVPLGSPGVRLLSK